MYYILWLENVIKMKMKCTNLILFFVGYFAVLAYGKFYKFKIDWLDRVLSRNGGDY